MDQVTENAVPETDWEYLGDNDACFIGVDIGGTKVSAGMVDRAGRILHTTRRPMVTDAGQMEAFAAVREVIDVTAQEANGRCMAIGVSCPGLIDPRTGVVSNAANVPCWREFPLASELQATYEVPIVIDNDANAAGLAEALWGAAANSYSSLYVTIGTGIGTALVLGKSVYRGTTGAAGEGGHMSIDFRSAEIVCNCRKRGCIEGLASGPAIARRARSKVAVDPERGGRLLELVAGDISRITSETVGCAWRTGDPLSAEILNETSEVLAVWFGNLIDLLEPEVLVVGGGLGELVSLMFGRIAEHLPRWSVNHKCLDVSLRLARYGPDSGVAGGAALCLRQISR